MSRSALLTALLGTCVCEFTAPKGVSPTSPRFHELHKAHHMTRFPNAGEATAQALDDLIASARRRISVQRARVS